MVPIAGTGVGWLTFTMVSPNHYRREAERCRELAAQSPDSDMAKRWRTLAADYDKLAGALEPEGSATPVMRTAMQQQPMQQQQAKTEPDEKK